MAVANYVWDVENDSYLMETDEIDNTAAVFTNEPDQYGRVASQRRGNDTSYYHFDVLGSTSQLTNAASNVSDSYLCDAFGNSITTTGLTINPFRYLGEFGYYFDPLLSTTYVRARFYEPAINRWCSQDPIGILANIVPDAYVLLIGDSFDFRSSFTTDLFTYTYNNPVAFSDPSVIVHEHGSSDGIGCCLK